MVAAVHRMLQCAAMASNVAQFRDRILVGLGYVPDALVLSILSPGVGSHHGDQGSVLERGRNFISTSGGSVFWMTRTTALVLKIRATY
jgi:hypothetical protein